MAASVISQNAKLLSSFIQPTTKHKIFKDECLYCFDSPESPGGLFVSLNNFLGTCKYHVERYFKKSKNGLFLHIMRTKKTEDSQDVSPPKKPVTKLAIGMEGGFSVDAGRIEYDEVLTLVTLPTWLKIPLPEETLPENLKLCIRKVIEAPSAAIASEIEMEEKSWNGEKRFETKHSNNLLQLENNVKISPSGWKCAQCDKTDNLWLNLTDGTILCGRKYADGSGGNNHAVEYYDKTHYPLAVKLGTITAQGADVYSYDEDDMVIDTNLPLHLAHFGIDMQKMEKTDKTMIELELELNQRSWEWSAITESDKELTPVYGPGYTGLANLGNTCYMNSVMQVLFSVPSFSSKYFPPSSLIDSLAPERIVEDLNAQIAKLAFGLLSGQYSKEPSTIIGHKGASDQTQRCIRPYLFRSLVAKGHPEFSTKKQQDAHEFLLHMFDLIDKKPPMSTSPLIPVLHEQMPPGSRAHDNPTKSFKFIVEERLAIKGTNKVNYMHKSDNCLSLPVPMDQCVNKVEFEEFEKLKMTDPEAVRDTEVVKAKIPFSSFLGQFAAVETIDNSKDSNTVEKTTRLKTFPDFLFIQFRKFTHDEEYIPKKLDVSVDVPDMVDLAFLRGHGKQDGEVDISDENLPSSDPPQPVMELNPAIINQLTDMGFPLEGCRRAVYHTNNAGIEQATNWVMEHLGDPDFATPFTVPTTTSGSNSSDENINEAALESCTSMGFPRDRAVYALRIRNNQLEAAVEWLMNHPNDPIPSSPFVRTNPLRTSPSSSYGSQASNENEEECHDGSEKYELFAFISHMGSSPHVGHYVCHIKKEGRWVIFNDEKVALSENPPKDMGYLYLFRRI